jgi:hypothetical protein
MIDSNSQTESIAEDSLPSTSPIPDRKDSDFEEF